MVDIRLLIGQGVKFEVYLSNDDFRAMRSSRSRWVVFRVDCRLTGTYL
jgi:hypothetical protein